MKEVHPRRVSWLINSTMTGLMLAMAACGGGGVTPNGSASGRQVEATSTISANAESPLTHSAPAPNPRRRVLASSRAVDVDALMDWAETTYPEYFPSHKITQAWSPYLYRYYPESGNYVGVAGDDVVVLGPLSGNVIVPVGKLADFRCLVYPQDCVIPRISKLAAGNGFTVLALPDGRVAVIGNEGSAPATYSGVLPGTFAKLVAGLSGIVSVHVYSSSLFDRSFALTADGSVYAWGHDNESMGLAKPKSGKDVVSTPTRIKQFSRIVEVQASDYRTMALRDDGTVWSLPGVINDNGVISAQQVTGLPGIKSLSRSGYGASAEFFALDTTGAVWFLKPDNGTRESANQRTVYAVDVEPMLFAPPDNTQVSCSKPPPSGHCLGLRPDGSVWAWGKNDGGQLGDGTTLSKSAPVKVSLPANVVVTDVSTAASHINRCSTALTSSGVMYFWGGSCAGRGNSISASINYKVPQVVPNIANVEAFSISSSDYVATMLHDGTVWSWGRANSAQAGTGTSGSSGSVTDDVPRKATGIKLK